MKTCIKCRQQKEIGDFYKHSQMADGHLNACKDCVKRDVRNNRQEKRDKYVQFDKARAMLPHRVEMRASYAKTPEGKAAKRRGQERMRALRPIRAKARNAVSYALQKGRLVRQPCIACGAEKAEAHHPDYSRPLDVQWLCRPHHLEVHRISEES